VAKAPDRDRKAIPWNDTASRRLYHIKKLPKNLLEEAKND